MFFLPYLNFSNLRSVLYFSSPFLEHSKPLPLLLDTSLMCFLNPWTPHSVNCLLTCQDTSLTCELWEAKVSVVSSLATCIAMAHGFPIIIEQVTWAPLRPVPWKAMVMLGRHMGQGLMEQRHNFYDTGKSARGIGERLEECKSCRKEQRTNNKHSSTT